MRKSFALFAILACLGTGCADASGVEASQPAAGKDELFEGRSLGGPFKAVGDDVVSHGSSWHRFSHTKKAAKRRLSEVA